MLGFWLAAGAMTVAAVAFVAARLLFPRRGPGGAEPRDANLAALRASWAELERDIASGLLPGSERERARAELAERAAEELDEGPSPVAARPARAAAALAAVLIPLAAYAAYGFFGTPAAIERAQAFEGLGGPLAPGRLPALRDELARHLADDPRDGRAWALLGRVELALDRYPEAAAAFDRATRASRKVAGDPGVWVDFAEAVGMAEGGTLVGRPERLVARALEIDPLHPRALELAGSLAAEKGDHAGAARQWAALLDRLDATDPRRAVLGQAIARAERLAYPGDMTPR